MKKIQIWFSDTVAIFLFLLAAGNLIVGANSSSLLDERDAIFPLPCRWVLVFWAAVELIISAWLLAARCRQVKLYLIVLMTAVLLLYRLVVIGKSAANFGDCLGNLDDWFPISPRTLGLAVNLLLGCGLLGGFAFGLLNWRMSRQARRQVVAIAMQQSQ